ncbi:unnamed protein product [Linum tenue]|nr:unnamed protein product [Linum tenue]
MVRVLI